MTQLTVGSLFSGIGGLDLGLERADMKIEWQCESDPYCRSILAKHWPHTFCYKKVEDINVKTPKVDLICGGFPCQPVSTAGKRQAEADPRWLWPEFARVISLLRPHYVLVENVSGLLTKGMGFILSDLSTLWYDAEWDCISAADIGAPHLRNRVFIVAYATGGRRSQRPAKERAVPVTYARSAEVADSTGQSGDRGDIRGGVFQAGAESLRRLRGSIGEHQWGTEPDVGRVAYGVSARVDRLRGLGNAVVPQVAEYVGRLIMKAEEGKRRRYKPHV